MSVPHPIPYQGSKRNLASHILHYFPASLPRLVEPFAGSAALSLAAAYFHFGDSFLLKDINAPLIRLWRNIVDEPETLANHYADLWHAQAGREQQFYNFVRTRFNQTQQPSDFLYLLARCVKASVRYNAAGEFNQSPDNRRKGRHPDAMRPDIQQASALFGNKLRLMEVDYRQIIDHILPTDLVYLDPPYQGVCANRDPRYIMGVDYNDFVKFLDELNLRGISYMVSYDGRTGNKQFGRILPSHLDLVHIELDAGRSSQSTLLGRRDKTYESLYLSSALASRIGFDALVATPQPRQLTLFGD